MVLIAALYLSRYLATPIVRLAEATRRLADGDLEVQVNVEASGEVQLLVESFNRMTGELRSTTVSRDEYAGLYEELQNSQEQLRQAQKMEAIGQLTAGIAHNFNNLLMVSMGNIELALSKASDPIHDNLKNALKANNAAAELTKELMVFSHGEDIDRTPTDVLLIVREVIEFCRSTFDSKIEIALDGGDAAAMVYGNANQLKQMMLNFCINARDGFATVPNADHQPRIQIDISAREFSAAECQTRPEAQPGHYICIAVADNGPGMDTETREHVFEPFFTTKDVGEGTGLGLATVYGIVHQHEGLVDLQSELGTGTTFVVYLPEARERRIETRTEKEGKVIGGTETVLVVDDDEGIRNLLQSVLTLNGYSILTGIDGEDGLQTYRRERERIDLVLLDVSMPRLSGLEVLAEVRALDPEAKVVMISGYAGNKNDFSLAQAFIEKPLSIPALLQTLRTVLDQT